VAAISAALSVLWGAPAAWAVSGNGMSNGMPWRSPNKITSGVPAHVASIAPCPAPPDVGDSVLVQVSVSFGPSGASTQIIAANPDGSWTGDPIFNFSGVAIRHTNIAATCIEFTGVAAIPYAQYKTRHTQVFS
jgi:hypothetical protein